jgi:hypothetical protein
VILLDERGAFSRCPGALLAENEFLFLRARGDDHHFKLRADHALELNEDLVLVAVSDARIVCG